MYTGKTEQPCCVCGAPDTVTRLDLPPRAIQLLENSDPIAWRDVVGEVSVYFCASDWSLVRDLALESGMHPLPKCNAARASFDLRSDFEALTDETREPPDQTALERELLLEAAAVGEDAAERDRVEAVVVTAALAELGVAGERA